MSGKRKQQAETVTVVMLAGIRLGGEDAEAARLEPGHVCGKGERVKLPAPLAARLKAEGLAEDNSTGREENDGPA